MKSYNGYRSWNAWNVSLWINNDETLYNHARALTLSQGIPKATRILLSELRGTRTPDGATYNKSSIYSAIKDII